MTSASERDPTRSDIQFSGGTPFIVTGFFTPNYFELAYKFSKNLKEHKISHHLYAREKMTGQWGHQTLQKPSVLKKARIDYPNSPLILMDVDCQVLGDISPILDSVGAIAVPMGRKPMKNGTALKPGTRVVMIRPTTQADAFLDLWDEMCRLEIKPVGNDEIRLQMAIEASAGQFAIATLPSRFTGMEIRKSQPEDVIVHDSARDESRLLGSMRKDIKHRFRVIRKMLYKLITGRDYKSQNSV
jgi:hypothetical protein